MRDRFAEEADNLRGLAAENTRLTKRIVDAEIENGRLREALAEMIETQDEWEVAMAKILGRPAGVFHRAIDRARSVLSEF